MAIAENSAVSLHYEMFDTNNQLLDKTGEPIAYLRGDYDDISPLVEEALCGREVDDTVDVVLSPGDAFGEYDLELVRVEDASVFPVEVGMGVIFEADDPTTDNAITYRVIDVVDSKAVMDGNHPLAGMEIRSKVTIGSVHDATDEEVAHGHIHGPHSHHH